jgi:glycosyltransferase involved in cell wall biosynthesis
MKSSDRKPAVVMIAYFFPPEGSAGVYRPLRFVRELSRKGWEASVIAGKPYRYERYDPELENRVLAETEIIRARGTDLWQAFQARRARNFKKRISCASNREVEEIRAAQYKPFRSRLREAVWTAEACWYIPDTEKAWIRPATRAAVKLCGRKRPDIIWATASPISGWAVAEKVSRRTGIPYVLDLRDPWGFDYYGSEIRRPAWAKHRFQRIMHRAFKGAKAVVFLFDAVAERYGRLFPDALDNRRVHIIPNGYDGAIGNFEVAEGNRCKILYTGTLSTYRYDTLLKALRLFKMTDHQSAQRLQLLFVGEGVESIANEAAALGLSDMIETRLPVSFAESCRLQQEAHALLILGRGLERKGYELVAGAKLFSYLKARRPFLGILPHDETRRILHNLNARTVADVDSPSEITVVLRKLVDAWTEGRLADFLPDRATCEEFSAERQTEALVRVFQGVQAPRISAAGSTKVPAGLQGEIGR